MINFLFFSVAIYLLGTIFQLHILFKLAYFFLGFHILLKFYHYNIEKNLVLHHQLKEDHVFLNEQIECQIEVENRSRFPILWLKIEETLPRKLTPLEEKNLLNLGPGETKKWQVSLKGRRRGFYQIGPLGWEAGDIVGYSTSGGFLKKMPVYVFPRLLTLEELGLPSRLPFGNIKWPQPIYKDPYQMVGIREYQPSDRLNKIHWKATARTGILQARENQSTVSLETAILLNLSQADYGLKWLERKTELAITTAASLGYYLNRIGQPFSFKTNGEKPFEDKEVITTESSIGRDTIENDGAIKTRARNNDNDAANNCAANEAGVSPQYISHSTGSGEMHLQKLLETLSWIEVTKKDNFLDLLTGQLKLSWGGTIIILTDKDTKELIETANSLIRRGYNIKIMLLGERVEHPEYLHRPFTAPLSIHHIRRDEDIYGL